LVAWLLGCVVASAFEATTTKQMFGKGKNAIYFWWGPVHFTFKMQVLSKQLLAAFLLHCLLF
jgi:hypothetical protein